MKPQHLAELIRMFYKYWQGSLCRCCVPRTPTLMDFCEWLEKEDTVTSSRKTKRSYDVYHLNGDTQHVWNNKQPSARV